MTSYLFIVIISISLIFSCNRSQDHFEQVLLKKTTFFDKNGDTAFIGKVKVWQRDNIFLQEVYQTTTHSDAHSNITTYVPLLCRYIDLNTKVFYDFYSFADTSRNFKRGIIDTLKAIDHGWRFYSDSLLEIASTPKLLPDTQINGNGYHRILFFQKGYHNDSTKNYSIGFFPTKMKYSILSLEKRFSKQNNWFLQKINDYYYSKNKDYLFSTREVEFLSHNLSPAETQVFNAWEQYAKEHPVK